ncbi:unnamed protein product [Victoria cruziana]
MATFADHAEEKTSPLVFRNPIDFFVLVCCLRTDRSSRHICICSSNATSEKCRPIQQASAFAELEAGIGWEEQ